MTRPVAAGALRWGSALLVWLALQPDSALTQTVTLDDAIGAALTTHPALGTAMARTDAAEEGLAAARASRLPTLALEASGVRFQEPMLVAPLHRFDPTTPPRFDETLVQGRLGLHYTLFDSGSRAARIRGAGAMVDAARSGGSSAEMEVIEQVTAAYLAVLTSRALMGAAEAQVEALRAEAERARQSVDAGTAAEVEAIRAGAGLQEAIAQLGAAESRRTFAERSLARLTGWDGSALRGRPIQQVRTPVDDAGGGRPALPTGGPGARASNPAIARAESTVRAAEARLADERSARLPRLSATAGLVDYGTLTGEHVAEWQGGLQLSWPVFTGGARSAAVRRAEADARAARGELALAQLRVEAAVDEASTSLREAEARASALASAVDQWAEVARIEALALDAGSGVQSDLLRAQAGLFQARAGHARALYDAVLARVRLARAEGVLNRSWLNETLEIDR